MVQEAPSNPAQRAMPVSVQHRRREAWPELVALENAALQTQPPAPEWGAIFTEPSRPLALDIGCGSGRFGLAAAAGPAAGPALGRFNHLGLEIRQPVRLCAQWLERLLTLVERALTWAGALGLHGRAHFLTANATVSVAALLATYPGRLQLVTVQYPDPHFKQRHKKRQVVQAPLVHALAALLPPTGHVFLQSDVEEAAAAMRDGFEQHGSDAFEVVAPAAAGHLMAHLTALADEGPPAEGVAPQPAADSPDMAGGEGQQSAAEEEEGPRRRAREQGAAQPVPAGKGAVEPPSGSLNGCYESSSSTSKGATHSSVTSLSAAGTACPAVGLNDVEPANRQSPAEAKGGSMDEEVRSDPGSDDSQAAGLEEEGSAAASGSALGLGQTAHAHRAADAAFVPTWGRHPWLQFNPLGVPTEREVHTAGQPIYRVLLRRRG